MKNFAIILGFLCCTNLSAQTLNFNDPLPEDETIQKGVLKNGMTYYIHKTDVIKNVASYYIIQNVGSVLENDEQQGLAHFLEHMAFNGTQNFPGKGILNTLQKHGAVFGKDINAYTSFDETVYNMDNIPTVDAGVIDTCLMVLRDWSNYLLLTDEEIDAERGVIKEEWRTRQNGGMRIFKQSLPTIYNNSKYSRRMPIGLMDVVDNFEYKALRDFYHDWYRTDLQAIAVVGDIDVEEIEQKIKKQFSSIPGVENPKERYIVDVPDHDEMLYNLSMDKEITTSNILFGIRRAKSLENQTVADLKESILNNMLNAMLSARLSEISQKPDAPFIAARIAFSSLSRSKNSFDVRIYPKPDQQHEAFKTTLTAINSAVKYGFTQPEIDRTIAMYTNSYQNYISKLEDRPHRSFIQVIKQNYLGNETMTDAVREYELVKVLFDQLTVNELHAHMKQLYTAENRVLSITGVAGNDNLTKEDALSIINDIENDNTLTAYSDEFSGKTLISGLKIKEGKIDSETTDEAVGSTTFILSNGIKVHYKFADKNKNDVRLQGISDGGSSLLDNAMLPSAGMVYDLVQLSGLGDYSSTDLQKVLAGKTASTGISITSLREEITGYSVTKDLETMLQMVHLRFVKPRFDQDSYKVLMNNIENYKIRRSENIAEKMSDSIKVTLYGNDNPQKRLFNDAYINDISYDKIKSIYLDRFNNAADFEFIIVGDVKAESLKPLLEKYMASIPTMNGKERWKDNSVSWVDNAIDKDIYLKMEDPKSSVRLTFENEFEYSLKNQLTARALKDILQLRFTETLREQEGGTYGARVGARLSKRPVQKTNLSVSFDCNPDKVEQLIAIVHKEIEKIKDGDIQQLDLDKTTTSYLKQRKQQQEYNTYEMSLLQNYFIEGYNMNDPENFEEIVNAITVKDIQEFTRKMLKKARSYEIVFKPKE